MRRVILFLPVVGLALAACAGASEAPTPLPTAVPPSDIPGAWAIAFEREFPSGFWGEGLHRYAFTIDCPVTSEELFSSDWQMFHVSEEAHLQASPIYLRLQGVSAASFTPSYIPNAVIHPDQQTIAVVYLLGMTKADAELSASECEGVVFRDDKGAQLLIAKAPFQP